MGFKSPIFISITLFGLASNAPTLAAEKNSVDPKSIPNAEDLIKHCWDISEEKRSTPKTGLMREGHLDTALCLEQEIINHASYLIYEGFYSREKIKREIRLIGKTFGNT